MDDVALLSKVATKKQLEYDDLAVNAEKHLDLCLHEKYQFYGQYKTK
jgi:hypothetical protein